MTKPWDLHEATIKKLYAENTLAVVRKTMIDKYNFKASTRAYRGKLIKWGVRKYNCRRQNDCTSVSAGSPDGSMSGSDTGSPISSPSTVQASQDFAGYSANGYVRDSQSRMSNQLGNSYDATNMETSRAYAESYGRNRALIPPTQDVHGWHGSPTQPVSPPASYSHANTVVASGSMYGYQPLSPPQSTYSPLPYESEQTICDRRQNYPLMPARQYGTSHGDPAYFPIRDYGHGDRSTGIGSFGSAGDQVSKHNSTS